MYFEWKEFPFRRPPELDGRRTRYDAAIVGGGPVGLAMALSLAQRGVRCVVLETQNQVSSGSRAIGVHRRTSQFFDRLGLGGPFGETARPRGRNIIYYGDQLVAETIYERPADEKWPMLMTLQQCWMEQIMLDGLSRHSGAEIRWGSTVTGLLYAADHVTLKVGTAEGPYEIEADFVIAADGARGSVRRWCGLEFETPVSVPVSERRFVICDFKMECDLPSGRRLWLDPPYQPGTIVIMHSQPFNSWRLDYAVEDGEDAEAEAAPEKTKERIARHLAMMGIDAPWTLLWTSVYRPLARSLQTYRQGRIFFVGDAAHQTPIFGGRGLNIGYADVANLAWKLAYALKGIGSEALLDSYSDERRAIVMEALEDLAQATIFMTRPTPGVSLMRDAALSLSLTEPFVAELFDAYRARRGEALESSFVTPDLKSFIGPKPGDPLPDARLRTFDCAAPRNAFLYDLIGPDFTALYFAVNRVSEETRLRLSRLERLGIPCKSIVISERAGERPERDAVIDAEGDAFKAFGARDGTLYLTRPDLHVAARWPDADFDSLELALKRAVGTPELVPV